MYNSALDMRDAGNNEAALCLLRTSLATNVVLAGNTDASGEADRNSSTMHDALKRCSLGFRLIPDHNLLEQGSLVNLLLLVCLRIFKRPQVRPVPAAFVKVCHENRVATKTLKTVLACRMPHMLFGMGLPRPSSLPDLTWWTCRS